eukprot:gene2574-3536_t
MGNNSGKFGFSSTAEEVSEGIDLSGKVVIVTGSNAGIGFETARVLALRGAHVIMACRSKEKLEKAIEEIKETNKEAKLTGLLLDLGHLESIPKFVEEFKKLDLPLHILVNNAGVMGSQERKTTQDGFEYMFGINHFGTFAVTVQLTPLMIKNAHETGKEGRIVILSSHGHKGLGSGKINYDDVYMEKKYDYWAGYGQSKLANVLFCNELNRKLKDKNITCNSVHPGMIKTGFVSEEVKGTVTYKLIDFFGSSFYKTVQQGAATSVFVACRPELEGKGGLYFNDCKDELSNSYSRNEENQKKFWDFTVKEIKLDLEI